MCKTDYQWEFTVLLRELKQELCKNLEGWEGEGGGGEALEVGNTCISTADSCPCMVEANKIP